MKVIHIPAQSNISVKDMEFTDIIKKTISGHVECLGSDYLSDNILLLADEDGAVALNRVHNDFASFLSGSDVYCDCFIVHKKNGFIDVDCNVNEIVADAFVDFYTERNGARL